MTAQTLFDIVVAALRAQGRQSGVMQSNGFSCRYRAPQPDGTVLKCAAGHILPDELYHPDMEGDKIDSNRCGWVFRSLVGVELMDLLAVLQSAHDFCVPAKWEERWQQVAAQHSLTYTPPLS